MNVTGNVRRAVCLVLILTGLLPAFTSAGADTEPRELSEVEVRARSLERQLSSELAEYGYDVEVITAEQIRRTGHTDVNQALQMLAPGAFVAPKNGRADYADVSVQGGRTADVLWMLDGVRFNNRLFSSSTILDSISVHMIDRIEVLKGGQGLFYGTQAISGVINIITRRPQQDRRGEAGVGVGSLNERNVHTHVTEGNRQGTKLLAFGNHDQSEGFEPFRDDAYETTATRTDRKFNRTNVGLKLQQDFGDGDRLSLRVHNNSVEADFARPFNQFQNALNDREQTIVSLKWDDRVSSDFSYFVKAYYHGWWTDFTRVAITDTGSLQVVNDRDEWGFDDYGINVLGRHTLPEGSQVLGGLDVQQYEGHDRVLGFETDKETVYAPFLQVRPRLPFSPNTKLAIGGRYNIADFTRDQFVWNASFRHLFRDGWYLRGRSGTAFRLPSGFELFDNQFGLGNPNLKPEESFNSELGLGGSTRLSGWPLSWSTTAFYREVEDLIQVGGSGQFENVSATVEVQGVEGQLDVHLTPQWTLKVNGTYSDATPSGSSRQINAVPEQFYKTKLNYEEPRGRYGLGLTTLWVGKIWNQPAGTRINYGDYTVTDLSGFYHLDRENRHRLKARLENVFDEEYATQIDSGDAVGGGDFVYENLGTPINLRIDYTYRF